jgi:hypothetical protein
MLELVKEGFIASFLLDLENTGIWSFLQVGSYKSMGHSLLLVGVGEYRDLELPLGWSL